MSEITDAMRAVDEWAEVRCSGCRDEASFPAEVIRTHPRWVAPHTCHEYRARAKQLALAAIEEAWDGYDISENDRSITLAEINRHWPKEEDTMTASKESE